MSTKLVTYLGFANSYDKKHLKFLIDEREFIKDKLGKFEDQIKIEHTLFLDSRHFNKTFVNKNICIFHFGGHAGKGSLAFADILAKSKDLTKMISQQENLRLVFLNGCATKTLVQDLLKVGIPAVIATSVSVGDEDAFEFSKLFYTALANEKTISQAFDIAAGGLYKNASKKENFSIKRYRGFKKEVIAVTEEDDFPWGLYENDDIDLDWKLTTQLPDPDREKDEDKFEIEPEEKVEFLEGVLEEMMKYNSSITNLDSFEDIIGRKEYVFRILLHFPGPISAQLRILVSKGEPLVGIKRLKQIYQLYTTITSFLNYCLITQILDNKSENPSLDVPEVLKQYFGQSDNFYQNSSYKTLGSLYRYLIDQKISPFLQEMKECIPEPDSELLMVYKFLESIRDQLKGKNFSEGELNEICESADLAITILLRRIAFFANYRLTAVKDIELFKIKYITEKFFHKHARLHQASDEGRPFEENRLQLNGALYSRSVLLIQIQHGWQPLYPTPIPASQKELDKLMKKYILNLSPLVLDKNSFEEKNKMPSIYLFDRLRNGILHYKRSELNIENPDDLLIINKNDKIFEVVLRQFKTIKEDFLSMTE